MAVAARRGTQDSQREDQRGRTPPRWRDLQFTRD